MLCSCAQMRHLFISRRQGASVEEMTAEVNRARGALETAQRDLKSMASLNRVSPQHTSPVTDH